VGHGHPHLVQIFDAGIDPTHDFVFVAMELLADSPSERSRASVPPGMIRQIHFQVASPPNTWKAAGSRTVISKPDNIVTSPDYAHATCWTWACSNHLAWHLSPIMTNSARFLGRSAIARQNCFFERSRTRLSHGVAITFYQLGAVLST